MDKELTITVKDIIKGIKERRVIFFKTKRRIVETGSTKK